MFNVLVLLQAIITVQQKLFHSCDLMCSKSRNEDKDNIDQDIDVCAIGVQTIMQSDHGTPRNQNKLKILRLILIPSV